MLTVLETQPVQYHAPVYRALQERFGIPVTAIYGSDFSVAGYRDAEFAETFAWDTDLLSGYNSVFLSRVANGGARSFEKVSGRGLGKAMQETKPKAVLLTGYRTGFNRTGLYHARKSRIPILFRAETTDHALHRSALKSFVRDTALRSCYGLTSKLLYIGQHSKDHYQRRGCTNGKLVFSPYCVDTIHFLWDEDSRRKLRPDARTQMGLHDDLILILYAGKLSVRKRPDLILQAVKLLPTAIRNNVVVAFLGSGELTKELEQLAAANPSVQVSFVGFKNQTELSPYYQAAEMLVLPSSEGETWGLVVNEALHHGVPCIVSDAVGCAPDLIESGVTGYVFENESAESLASSMQRMLDLIGHENVRNNCRAKVQEYSVEKAAGGIAEAYREVALA